MKGSFSACSYTCSCTLDPRIGLSNPSACSLPHLPSITCNLLIFMRFAWVWLSSSPPRRISGQYRVEPSEGIILSHPLIWPTRISALRLDHFTLPSGLSAWNVRRDLEDESPSCPQNLDHGSTPRLPVAPTPLVSNSFAVKRHPDNMTAFLFL